MKASALPFLTRMGLITSKFPQIAFRKTATLKLAKRSETSNQGISDKPKTSSFVGEQLIYPAVALLFTTLTIMACYIVIEAVQLMLNYFLSQADHFSFSGPQ